MIFSTFEGKTWATTRIAGLFALLVLVFFSPALLNGRLLAPLGDGLFYYYPLRVYAAEVVSRGHLPLWNPLIFSGFPLLADIEVGVFYPPNWLFFILPAPLAMNLVVLLSYVIAGLSTYLYARAIGATPFGAVVSGLTFMLSGFMVSHLGHISIINAACWLPLLLFFLERMRQRVTWSLVTGGALTLGVQVLGSHPQIILYSLMVYVLYVGFFGLAHRPPSGRAGYLLGAAGVLGGGLLVSACQILPTWELASQSVRAAISYGAFTDHSLRLSHLLLFLFPYFFGGFSDGFYFPWWGYMTGLTEYSGYVGITPLLLILTVLFQVRRSRHVLFWLLCASFALLLALGENTPLYKIMYYVPLYNLFRASARHLLEVDLALAVLAGLGVTFLSQGYCRKPSLSVALAAAGVLAVVGGLCLLLVRKGPQFSALINLVPPPSAQVFTLANPALFLPLSFALLVCCSWFCYVCWPHRGMQAFTLFLLFADLGFFGEFCHWRFSSPTIDALQRHPLAVRSLKGMDSEMESYRLLSLSSSWLEENHYFAAINGANSSILQGIANASGSSSLMLTRYRAISDSSILHEGQALDLLNVRYLLVPDRLLSPQPEIYVQGVGFPREKLEVELSRNRPDRAELSLPPLWCSAIVVTSSSISGLVPDDHPLIKMTVWTKAGQRIERVLHAGWDMPEWIGEQPWTWARIKHWLVRVTLPSKEGTYEYRSMCELGGRQQIEKIRFDYLASPDALRITQLAFYDAKTQHFLRIPRDRDKQTVRLSPPPHRLEVTVPSVPCSAVILTSALSGSKRIKQGQPVARVSVWTEEGEVIEKLLRVGEDTSEWAWERPDVRAWVKYQKAPVAQSFAADGGSYQGHWYLGQLELGGRYRVERIKIAPVAPDATLSLAKISFYDKSTGTSTPFSLIRAYLSDQAQWQRRFSTEGVTVYENARALPRAWLVPRVQNLPARDILRTIRTGTLPDGTVFEPRHIALVENVPDLDFGPLDPAAEVEIVDYQPNRLTVRSQCRTASFLVMSEIAYPGWKAAIDGEPAPMVRTNYILRGLALPPGTHRIDFVYAPLSFKIGVAISGVTLLGLLGGSLVILLWSPLVCRSPKPIT